MKCEPCSGKTPKLKPEEISNYLSQLDGWSVNNEQEMVFKKFNFKNFKKVLTIIFKIVENYISQSTTNQDPQYASENKVTSALWSQGGEFAFRHPAKYQPCCKKTRNVCNAIPPQPNCFGYLEHKRV